MSSTSPVAEFSQGSVESAAHAPKAADNVDLEKTTTSTPIEAEAYSVFTRPQKRWIVLLVGIASFFSPLSANIYFPALSSLSADLNVSTELINLTITSYMILQALAPMLIGDLADTLGRRPVYILLFVIYIAADIGLALQRAYPALLVLRMLQSTGSSGVIALASGVVADIAHAGERGAYMGAVNLGAMCGPAVGPVIGGVLADKLGWWWIFWILAICGGVYLVFHVVFFPETGRSVVGNGSIPPPRVDASLLQLLKGSKHPIDTPRPPRPKLRAPNPMASLKLLLHKDMALVLFINGIFYTAFYMIMASLPSVFADIYGLTPLQVGLCYLPFGVGCGIACIIAGRLMGRDYKIIAQRCGIKPDAKRGEDMLKFPIEQARLRSVFWSQALFMAAIVTYGWLLHFETHLAAPLFLTFVVGVAGTCVFTVLSTLVVDLYQTRPSSATACNNFVRCLMGAAGTAVIESMLQAMGRGWCFTFVGIVCTLMAPLLFLEWKYGMRWRVARLTREKEAERG